MLIISSFLVHAYIGSNSYQMALLVIDLSLGDTSLIYYNFSTSIQDTCF